MDHKFNPELQLSNIDRAHLAHVMAMPGYKVIHDIFRSEVDKFFVQLINADPSDSNAVLKAHEMAKAAAQFYTGTTNRINAEANTYFSMPRPTDIPVDTTQNVLDLDDISEAFMSLPNLLEEEE